MPLIPTALAGVSIIGGLFSDSKDPGRLASNQAAYSDALAGDKSALQYLKARSGQYGLLDISPPWKGDPVSPLGGWATSTAKQDAATKYNAASSALAGVPLTTPATTSPLSFGDKLVNAISGFGQTVGTAAGQAASGGQTGQAVQKVASTTNMVLTVALVAALGLGAYYVARHVK